MTVAILQPVLACPVCFGAADGPLVNGSTLGILTLLVVTAAMLCAFGGFFLTLRRRSAAASRTEGRAQAIAPLPRGERAC